MGDDDKKPGFDWYDPMSRRGRAVVVVIAGLVVVGAVIAAVVLGIPFF
ncbi:hypothetical protein GCM10027413_26660 [Conyzicola nivalis]|uniref:Uncharacterized protein n=1 Tax=Conyzicola nivalis TaxID=1477021 RepID=A0A916SVE5_9MICO|nr:hypothetical protein [Conyzicola nivalis]GGB15673.1 hypothetical protein GCM10010979_32850 [Conyzicola nivalis]